MSIPGPKPLPVLGNLLDIDVNEGLASLIKLGQKWGPIFSLTFAGRRETFVCSRELADQLCDETRFHKLVNGPVEKLRPVAGNGLFTAPHGNEDWAIAHRTLVPLFGPLGVRDMFDGMLDIAGQLCLKWARFGSSTSFDAAGEFTRLTLDTIALCTMDFRFNSFYREGDMHPFVSSMVAALSEADKQGVLPDMANLFRSKSIAEYKDHIEKMNQVCREIIAHRRKYPKEGKPRDLLDTMLNAKDDKTGRGLSDQSVIHNLLTFLIAGHETTSGLLSFTLYYLLENPDTLEKARQEVLEVLGAEELSVRHLQKLPYLDACLRESLRLSPTAPGFTVTPFNNEIVHDGDTEYILQKGSPYFLLLHSIHRDTAVWGPDADEFKPERMLNVEFDKLPKNAWKPFGNGVRGCIGRAFAWQESQMILALLLRDFDIRKADPNYKLKIKQTLTIKPVGFEIKISVVRGFSLQATGPMNEAHKNLQRGHPVVFVAASYDGQPAGNASEFMAWLSRLEPGSLTGVRYAVFGCGNRDWQATYFKVPRVLDEGLSKAGAERLVTMGMADSATSDVVSELEDWMQESLWPRLSKNVNVADGPAAVKRGNPSNITLGEPARLSTRKGFVKATVTEARVLSAPGVSQKRHLELRLPEDMEYDTGDHLQVLPANSNTLVQRVLSKFHISADTTVTLSGANSIGLPVGVPITAGDLFTSYVELTHTASAGQIRCIADSVDVAAEATGSKAELQRLANGDCYKTDILERHTSVLDLLERFPAARPPLSAFLSMLPPVCPRTYSISSAPSWKPGYATLTYSVVGPHDSNMAGAAADLPRAFRGTCSSYLAALEPGHVVYVRKGAQKNAFRAPAVTDASVPLIMVAAGSGLAPFRAILQQRLLAASVDGVSSRPAPALLFFGCRGPELDSLYQDELDVMEREGIVEVRRAYSRGGDGTEGRYVQDAVVAAREEAGELWDRGARVLVCSSKKVADDVLRVMGPILFEFDRGQNRTKRQGLGDWGDDIRSQGRWVAEVFN
ncbi:hypothetical protein JX265_001284 [Neoarthrinium moseri]|uniref:Bifunctional cytochrome P450/NADPH--P450 reductase n=1 Tax=Neoarthrinium moseri TaxID=1658444 RepID=A0A9P9WXX8_9PEZI|nr:hypothetical protein JX265_001284 [Neoarthrinium moseri]